MTTVFGTPATKSRPLISIVCTSSLGYAEPMVILISSAVRSPTRRLYLRLMNWAIASSILSPPTRTERENTIPEREITATSVVPPPISTIIFPVGSVIGKPEPMAAAIGSSIKYTSRAPADSADSRTARFSTSVMPNGTPTIIRGLTSVRRL